MVVESNKTNGIKHLMRCHLIITGCLLLITACAGKAKLPDETSAGAELYAEKCSGCHQAYPPQDNQYYQWERLFTLIEQGWSHKEIKEPLSQDDKQLILQYLKAHARPEHTEDELLDMQQKKTGVYQ